MRRVLQRAEHRAGQLHAAHGVGDEGDAEAFGDQVDDGLLRVGFQPYARGEAVGAAVAVDGGVGRCWRGG